MRTVVEAIAGQRGRGTLRIVGDQSPAATPWAEVHRRARLVARDLAARGIRPGDRVALLGETHIDLVVALQATWLAGAAVTVLPMPAPSMDAAGYAEHLRRIVMDARPRLVLIAGPSGSRGSIAPLAPVADLHEVAGSASSPGASSSGASSVEVGPDDLALLQYTSGSTRAPRGVPMTHGQLAANLDAIHRATGHERVHGKALSWLPLYHDMGFVGVLCSTMACGCDLVLMPTSQFADRPLSWLEQVAATGATQTAAPNFAWALAARLLKAIPAPHPTVDLRSLRLALSGGEPIDPVAMAGFLAAAAPHGFDPTAFVGAYGLAEATLAVTMSDPGAGLRTDTVDPHALERGTAEPADAGRALVRLGRAVPGTQVRIVADHDPGGVQLLGDRQVGHVEVSGPAVTGGYWGEPAAPPGRWLRTGDLGYLVDGELVVCGRVTDLLFAAGRNIHPQDVEVLALAVPRVRPGGAAAFGLPGNGGADRLAVVVESAVWADPDEAEAIRTAVRGAVTAGIGLTPRHVAVVAPGGLARTSSGKLRRQEIRRHLIAGILSTASDPIDSGKANR